MKRLKGRGYLLSGALVLIPIVSNAYVIDQYNGGSLGSPLPPVSLNDGALADGTVDVASSSFNQTFASGMNGGTDSVLFSAIPVSNGFFNFVFDSQETGGNPQLTIDSLTVSAMTGGQTYSWSLSGGNLEMNYGATPTLSPLGNDSDFQLSIPISIFSDKGFTGADSLDFTWTSFDGSNGSDEWALVGDGFFDPGDPVTAVPVPAAAWLFGSGILGFLTWQRRKNRTAD